MRNYAAEFFGTFWLVFGGCGSAIFAAGIPELGIGYAGVSLAFGLTVLTMAYAVGIFRVDILILPFHLDYLLVEDLKQKNFCLTSLHKF